MDPPRPALSRWPSRRVGFACAVLGALVVPRRAHAESVETSSEATAVVANPPEEEPSPWHVDLAIGTVVPMDIGGRVVIQGPERIFLSLGLGIMPDAYVDIINSTAEGLDLYHARQSRLIEDSLHDAITFRSALGWFPWADLGFFGSVGYAFQGLGGRSSPGEVVRAATNVDPPITGLVDVEVEANLHILTVDFGYKWFFQQNLFLQVGVGGEFTLAAHSSIEPEFGLRSFGPIERFTRAAEERLNDLLEDNVHHPTVTLLVGARGF